MNVLKVSGWKIAAFVLPCLLIYSLLVFVPILVSFYSGLLDWNGIGAAKFIGLKNFEKMLTNDPIFWPAVGRTMLLAGVSMCVQLPIALFIAILISRYVKKPNFLVSSYFLPVILSVVVIGQLWKTIYNPASMGGMLNQILESLGLNSWTHSWLTEPKIAIYSVIVVALWQYLGYHILIQFTGIQNIPSDIYEAAKIDGASGLKADRYITLPLIVPIFKISVVLSFIGSLQSFDLIMVMTGGGPAHATEVVASLMYNMSFLSMKYGYGSAIASFLVILCLAATIIINGLFSKLDKRYS
ncbi:sugar ABC transporter permease [Paenibacillus motobuensis]|uniref:carbohydrate ABC transporter permease n=1 Tax=Paenibacillus TaxID=44249 RepID=UPI00203AD776|nr:MULTISPECIES: sugar ABC transporter permease [Paenibacillus]MCM3039801.1 sugar ABC transporter permease [Paenibacillus lutimineralis]MCM3646905.1 sugar ABC transporter permease [Paenibacillus motobuensis]